MLTNEYICDRMFHILEGVSFMQSLYMWSIYRQIARMHGTTAEQVRKEIQEAVTAAWNKPDKTEEERRNQAQVPCHGKVPTPEEFMLYCYGKIYI